MNNYISLCWHHVYNFYFLTEYVMYDHICLCMFKQGYLLKVEESKWSRMMIYACFLNVTTFHIKKILPVHVKIRTKNGQNKCHVFLSEFWEYFVGFFWVFLLTIGNIFINLFILSLCCLIKGCIVSIAWIR